MTVLASAHGGIAIAAGAMFLAYIGFHFLVPTRRWPFVKADSRVNADRYYDPRTRRWTTTPPEGEDATDVRRVRGGQSLIRSGLQQLEAEGFTRAERTFAMAWGMAGALLPALGVALLVADRSTRIPGLICLIGGLLVGIVPMGHILRSRVRRRQQDAAGPAISA